MSNAGAFVQEYGRRGSYSGVGPHSVPTGWLAAAACRFITTVTVMITDHSTNDVHFVAHASMVKYSATGIELANVVVGRMATGWESTSMGVSIVDDEIIGSVTIPDGYAVDITYRIDGLLA